MSLSTLDNLLVGQRWYYQTEFMFTMARPPAKFMYAARFVPDYIAAYTEWRAMDSVRLKLLFPPSFFVKWYNVYLMWVDLFYGAWFRGFSGIIANGWYYFY